MHTDPDDAAFHLLELVQVDWRRLAVSSPDPLLEDEVADNDACARWAWGRINRSEWQSLVQVHELTPAKTASALRIGDGRKRPPMLQTLSAVCALTVGAVPLLVVNGESFGPCYDSDPEMIVRQQWVGTLKAWMERVHGSQKAALAALGIGTTGNQYLSVKRVGAPSIKFVGRMAATSLQAEMAKGAVTEPTDAVIQPAIRWYLL